MLEKKFVEPQHSRIFGFLEKIVGKSFVSDNIEELYYYSTDPSAEEPVMPEYVVMPGTVGEIQEIVRLANREKIPITPRVAGLTLSGLSLPIGGGILIDLKRMNKILEVNPHSMYAVVECGVTTGQLKTYLDDNYPDLWFTLPHAPPSVGVISNAIIHGAGQISLKYGISSEMIAGLEVVLPTGELMRTGSIALGKSWFSKYCLPDFIGLFLGWFGATGIITKASIHLWPRPKVRDMFFYKIDDVDDSVYLLMKLIKSEVCDDIYVNSWTGSSIKRYYTPEKPPDMPEIVLDVFISGQKLEEFEVKKQIMLGIVEEALQRGVKIEEFTPPASVKENMLRVPQPLPFMDLRIGGGAEYLGVYMPTEVVGEAYKKGIDIAKKHGFQYLHLIRPFRTGHATGVMYTFPFVKESPDEVERVHKALEEIADMAIEMGGVLWKPAPSLHKQVLEYADPEYVNLIKKIKKLLDPNGIMAPGKWVT